MKNLIIGMLIAGLTGCGSANMNTGTSITQLIDCENYPVIDSATGKQTYNTTYMVFETEWLTKFSVPGKNVGEMMAHTSIVNEIDGRYVDAKEQITFHTDGTASAYCLNPSDPNDSQLARDQIALEQASQYWVYKD